MVCIHNRVYDIDLFEDYEIHSNGEVFSKKRNIFLKEKINTDGYRCVDLWNENGKLSNVKISRLVAEYFVKNTNNENIVDHIDRNRTNDDYQNLRWVNRLENNLNTKKRKDNKSGFVSVWLNEKNHMYQSSYQKEGKRITKSFTFRKNDVQDKIKKFKEACEWRQKMTDENYNPTYFKGNI
jgi:hypothetical protein